MKTHLRKWTVAGLVAAFVASGVGCYPVYPPGSYNAANGQDSKGYSVPQQAAPPVRYAVDPGLAVAGIAAAGILGYAIGNQNSYQDHYYRGPVYYRPAPYYRGYYGPRYYR